jgi:hypothetical protein
VLDVLFRHVLIILVILTRVSRDGLLRNFLHETSLQFVARALAGEL